MTARPELGATRLPREHGSSPYGRPVIKEPVWTPEIPAYRLRVYDTARGDALGKATLRTRSYDGTETTEQTRPIRLTKNGDWMTPQITSADCPSANVMKKIALPPTMRARRCSPRRQTLIVASTKKMSRSNTLSWPIKVQGFGTPTGAETISPPHHESCRRLVISR